MIVVVRASALFKQNKLTEIFHQEALKVFALRGKRNVHCINIHSYTGVAECRPLLQLHSKQNREPILHQTLLTRHKYGASRVVG